MAAVRELRPLLLVTTEAVLWECLNFFSPPPARARAFDTYSRVRSDPRTEVIGFSPALCEAAVALYAARPDKGWGVFDCLSFAVMRQRGLTEALTFDRHFEQAGFKALLLHDPPA